jgi:hypothetical protein
MVILSRSTVVRCIVFLIPACCISTIRLSNLLTSIYQVTPATPIVHLVAPSPPANPVTPSAHAVPSSARVLIFLTTHFSRPHREFLQRCWPHSIANSQLLQKSDIFVFSTGRYSRTKSLLENVFASNRLTIHQEMNPGKQGGAILALKLAELHGWFDNYDWVIRLNPDVIIKNDTEILLNIMDPNMDGIFINCKGRNTTLHTDFSVFRPSALPPEKFTSNYSNAEIAFTEDMQSILQSGRYVWLPFSRPSGPGICRVVGDVVAHLHSNTSCPLPLKQGPGVEFG